MKKKSLVFLMLFVILVPFFNMNTVNAEGVLDFMIPEGSSSGYGVPEFFNSLNSDLKIKETKDFVFAIPVFVRNKYGLQTMKNIRVYLKHDFQSFKKSSPQKVFIPISDNIGVVHNLEDLKELSESQNFISLDDIIQKGKIVYTGK